MNKVVKVVLALIAGFAIGALVIAEYRSSGTLRTSGSSAAYSVYVPSKPADVFAVLANIDAWPTWQDDILQVVRDSAEPNRVRLLGEKYSAEYDVVVDDYGLRIQLTTLPAGDLTKGYVTIQVERTRRGHSRITVDEYIQLQRQNPIGGNEHSRYALFRNFASSFDDDLADQLGKVISQASHWDPFLGCWTTSEERLAADGTSWEASRPAEWRFEPAFDGLGIMDTYTSPPPDVSVRDEQDRQRGINLRIYNAAEGHWVTTWLTTASTAPVNFVATPVGDSIVMEATTVNPQGLHNRVTFFDITGTSFEWKLELSKDRKVWTESYRIHGTRGCITNSRPN